MDPGETCDGTNLDGQDCTSLGFHEAPGLACDSLCAFDLDYRRLTFTPRASPPGYNWTDMIVSGTSFPELFGAGQGTYTALNLADNAGQWVDLPFSFTFYGAVYTRVYVQSNLYLTFGTAVDQAIHDRAQFFAGPPRVAFFWDDYDTQTWRTGDDLHVNVHADRAVITANRLNDKNLGAGYDWYTHAQVILRASGVIEIIFLDCTNGGGIVGITPGGGCFDNGNVNFN